MSSIKQVPQPPTVSLGPASNSPRNGTNTKSWKNSIPPPRGVASVSTVIEVASRGWFSNTGFPSIKAREIGRCQQRRKPGLLQTSVHIETAFKPTTAYININVDYYIKCPEPDWITASSKLFDPPTLCGHVHLATNSSNIIQPSSQPYHAERLQESNSSLAYAQTFREPAAPGKQQETQTTCPFLEASRVALGTLKILVPSMRG